MALTKEQKKAFDFLKKSFQDGRAFFKDEFQVASGWSKKTFSTHFSKQFKRLLIEVPPDKFRVTEVFRRYNSEDLFESQIVTQNRKVRSDYDTFTYNNLIIFEFFMPLTNEGFLRSTLDSLFYKDTIGNRLRVTNSDSLNQYFPRNPGELDGDYFQRILDWVSNTFIGYSISHVNGRFRAAELQTINESANELLSGGRYLVDETTAIVKFIFPVGKPQEKMFNPSTAYFDQLGNFEKTDYTKEADTIRWFFYILFVQSIVQVVNGEDEIWMVESGMKSKLHIWRVKK